MLAVNNEPGSLVRCLEILAAADLNIGKLESRPSRERAWEYVFWVELDADAAAPATAAAITALGRVASMVRAPGPAPGRRTRRGSAEERSETQMDRMLPASARDVSG